MNLLHNDIIIALATPMGEGAISIIRLSGNGAIEKVAELFKGKSDIRKSKTHSIHYGIITTSSGETIDDVLVSIFKNPNSYTGEDSVEISSHASIIVVKKIIEEFVKNGVRLAEPGEFTKRAFLNGKMDLAQAEAVADIINSRTEASLRGARNQLDGILSQKIDFLRRELINSTSLIELELDFAEEDLEFISPNDVINKIEIIIAEIDKLLSTYSFGKVVREGVNVAIVGRPNVGKSSLLNYIVKDSRAIVSEIPGTTRDIISEEISIDGILFKLFDTAGIRLTNNAVEQEGVKRSKEAIKNADIILLIDEVVNGIDKKLYNELINLIPKERIITVLNKSDLSQTNNTKQKVDIYISVLNGNGLTELLELLKKKALGNNSFTEKSAVINNVRHYNSLFKAKAGLKEAIKSLKQNLSGEFVSINLRAAEDSLGEIIGKVTTDDILNNIFDNFCIGK
jgi:tRNA modification GTPase